MKTEVKTGMKADIKASVGSQVLSGSLAMSALTTLSTSLVAILILSSSTAFASTPNPSVFIKNRDISLTPQGADVLHDRADYYVPGGSTTEVITNDVKGYSLKISRDPKTKKILRITEAIRTDNQEKKKKYDARTVTFDSSNKIKMYVACSAKNSIWKAVSSTVSELDCTLITPEICSKVDEVTKNPGNDDAFTLSDKLSKAIGSVHLDDEQLADATRALKEATQEDTLLRELPGGLNKNPRVGSKFGTKDLTQNAELLRSLERITDTCQEFKAFLPQTVAVRGTLNNSKAKTSSSGSAKGHD